MNQLYSRDDTGPRRVSALLALGSRSDELDLQAADGWTGNLTEPPAFEFKMLSPAAYREYLVLKPNRMSWPKVGRRDDDVSKQVTLDREALLRGDVAARQAALQGLAKSRQRGNWWVFEGTTNVDCVSSRKG